MSNPELYLQIGEECPYDHDSDEDPRSAVDWAEAAARGVLSNLRDRRGIKWELEAVDMDVRPEIVESIAEIIRVAHRAAPKPPAE